MAQDAGDGRASRRLRSCRPRVPEQHSAPLPPCPREPADVRELAAARTSASGVPDLRELLADIDDLRLALSADLELAASAVDAGAVDVARDVVAGASDDLALFTLRTDLRLHDTGCPAPAVEPPVAAPARRRSRRMAVLAPALTAAAALVGLLTGVVPTVSPAAPARSVVTNAAASYAELWRLHEQGAPASQLAQAARQLHAELERLVDQTALDAATAEQALKLLELELRVLGDPQHDGALTQELAESQRLVAALRAAAVSTPAALLAESAGGAVQTGLSSGSAGAPAAAPAAPAPGRRAASTTMGPTGTAPQGAARPAPPPASEPAQQQTAEQQKTSTEPSSQAQPSPKASPAPAADERSSAQEPRGWFPPSGPSRLP